MKAPVTRTCRATAPLFTSIPLVLSLASITFGATLEVGAGKPYTTLASLPTLNPGDRVEISPGTYNEVRRWLDGGSAGSPITIIGVGASRPVIDGTGLDVGGTLPNPRAVFQIEAGDIVVENLEFINARNSSDNGAGIRITGSNAVGVTLRGCKITYCDMGMMSDSCDEVLIESCEFGFNGSSDDPGYNHGLYLGGEKTTLKYCYIHDSLFGQNLKSRGHYTEILYCYIADSQDGEIGLVDAAETEAANANAVMIGCVIVSKYRGSGWNSNRFIQFGQDQGRQHNGTLYAINNTFVAGTSSIRFFDSNATGSAIVSHNNVLQGSSNISTGNGPVTGSNNWIKEGVATPAGFVGSIQGSDPGFVNEGARDYHVAAGSPCLDVGSGSLTYRDNTGSSLSGVPGFEYVDHLLGTARLSDGSLDCGAYEMTVLAAPLILTPPSDLTVFQGETATFSVNASGTAPLSYQWEVSTDGGATWADIGTDSSSYATPATSAVDDGNRYRVTVSNAASPDASSTAATLTVSRPDQEPVVLITAPADGAALSGDFTLSVQAHDPDVGTADGDGIEHVAIVLERAGRLLATVTDTTQPYTLSLGSASFADGTYTIRATGTSTAAAGGNSAIDSVSITFANLLSSDLDTDGEGLPDWWEELHGLDANLTDSDGNTILDIDEDPDADGYTNLEEYVNGSDPNVYNAPPQESDGGDSLSCAAGGSPAPGAAALAFMALIIVLGRRADPTET